MSEINKWIEESNARIDALCAEVNRGMGWIKQGVWLCGLAALIALIGAWIAVVRP